MTVTFVQRTKCLPIARRPEQATVSIRVIQQYVSPVPYYPFVLEARINRKSSQDMYERTRLNFVKRFATKKG